MKSNILDGLKTTIKLQPVVLLYSWVSIGSKLVSKQIPGWTGDIFSFALACLMNWKLVLLLFSMFAVLFIYAFIWQRLIKNVPITIMYANKSSYIFWTQLAAIVIFAEKLNWCNIIGIIIIFMGIMVVNSDD